METHLKKNLMYSKYLVVITCSHIQIISLHNIECRLRITPLAILRSGPEFVDEKTLATRFALTFSELLQLSRGSSEAYYSCHSAVVQTESCRFAKWTIMKR